jgi:hypothetical protein
LYLIDGTHCYKLQLILVTLFIYRQDRGLQHTIEMFTCFKSHIQLWLVNPLEERSIWCINCNDTVERREAAGMVNIAMSLFASILGCGWKPHLWCIIVIFLHLLEKRSRLSFSPIIPSLHACARALARLRACFLESASLWWKLWRINQPHDLASIKEVEEPLATLIKTTKSISISDCPCLCCQARQRPGTPAYRPILMDVNTPN